MISLTIDEFRQFSGGYLNKHAELIKDETVHGVSIDTRTIEKDNLFAPFVGDNVDGHKFIKNAIKSGARVALSEKENIEAPLIIVEDVEKALGKIAKKYLEKIGATVIAITGSNGKTTTKDMMESVLTPHFKVKKTQGNYNNEIGLPLTVFNLDLDTEIAILEMGMDRLGDIDYLSAITEPNIAVLTNVGESHLEKLGSRENIAKAKYEIVNHLKPDGLFVYSNDYTLLKDLVATNVPYTIQTSGKDENNNIVIGNIFEDKDGTIFTVNNERFSIPSLGKHNAMNASFAIIVAKYLGVSEESIRESLKTLEVTDMRMEQHIDKDSQALIINDAYNASPASMISAIDTIRHLNYKHKILVLGDILELGTYKEALHHNIATHINEDNQFEYVFTFGEAAKTISEMLNKKNGEHFTDIDKLKARVYGLLNEDTVMLLKGSRGMALERVIK